MPTHMEDREEALSPVPEFDPTCPGLGSEAEALGLT